MPAFKFQQNNSLIVLGRGHKARGYELALGFSPKIDHYPKFGKYPGKFPFPP
jgi:hypothetical protein